MNGTSGDKGRQASITDGCETARKEGRGRESMLPQLSQIGRTRTHKQNLAFCSKKQKTEHDLFKTHDHRRVSLSLYDVDTWANVQLSRKQSSFLELECSESS
jgi:hypothetical protein